MPKLLTVAAIFSSLALGAEPKVVLESVSYNFGTVRQGEQVTHAFTIRNAGDAALNLSGVELSTPGMRLRKPPVLAPGAAGRITLEWNTAGLRGKAKAEALVRLDAPAMPELKLTLEGFVQPLVEFRPMRAAFFSIWAGETAQQTITIVNNDVPPMAISRIEPKGSHFRASIRPVQAGRVYELNVDVPAGTEPGRFMESLELVTDHPRYPRIPVPVNVLVKTEIYANPETVGFGQVPLAKLHPGVLDLLAQTFLVKKRSGEFQILSVDSGGLPLVVKQTPENGPSRIFQFDVRLAQGRLAKGPLTGTIRIRTNDPRFPALSIPVTGEVN